MLLAGRACAVSNDRRSWAGTTLGSTRNLSCRGTTYLRASATASFGTRTQTPSSQSSSSTRRQTTTMGRSERWCAGMGPAAPVATCRPIRSDSRTGSGTTRCGTACSTTHPLFEQGGREGVRVRGHRARGRTPARDRAPPDRPGLAKSSVEDHQARTLRMQGTTRTGVTSTCTQTCTPPMTPRTDSATGHCGTAALTRRQKAWLCRALGPAGFEGWQVLRSTANPAVLCGGIRTTSDLPPPCSVKTEGGTIIARRLANPPRPRAPLVPAPVSLLLGEIVLREARMSILTHT